MILNENVVFLLIKKKVPTPTAFEPIANYQSQKATTYSKYARAKKKNVTVLKGRKVWSVHSLWLREPEPVWKEIEEPCCWISNWSTKDSNIKLSFHKENVSVLRKKRWRGKKEGKKLDDEQRKGLWVKEEAKSAVRKTVTRSWSINTLALVPRR